MGDMGTVDMGYHFPLAAEFDPTDLNRDGVTNWRDFALLVQGGAPEPQRYMVLCTSPIAIDGDVSDWPGGTIWRPIDQVFSREPNDVSSAEFAVMWNGATNKVNLAVRVVDDVHVITDEYVVYNASDRLEIYSQGDAAGGTGWSQVWDVVQHYMIGPDTAGGSWGNWALDQTLDPNMGLEYAAVVSGDTYTYKAAVPQYDNYGGFSGGATIPTTLTEDNTVRFDLLVLTRHSSGYGWLGENTLLSKFSNANRIAPYTLAGPEGLPDDINDDGIINLFDQLHGLLQFWLQ